LDRAATVEAAGEVRAKVAEATSGRRGSGGSDAWVACCYYCTDELLERAGPQPLEHAGRDPPMKRGIGEGGQPDVLRWRAPSAQPRATFQLHCSRSRGGKEWEWRTRERRKRK